MPKYIVRPRKMSVFNSSAVAQLQLGAAARSAQIQEAHRMRLDDPVDRELRNWLAQSPTVRHLSLGESHTKATSTTVLEMTEGEAAQLADDIDDLMVLKDRPIELIRPMRPASASATTTTPALSKRWHLKAIGLREARAAGFRGTGAGVTISVLDTGVDQSHVEFQRGSASQIAGSATFNVDNWSWQDYPHSHDTEEHGTHVAGLICGKNVGVAPDAQVVSGIMIPMGRGNLSDFVLALEWTALNEQVSIMNMSAGIRGFESGMTVVIEDLLAIGILPVIATGNEGAGRTRSPGNYQDVLSVGASNRAGKVANFSSSAELISDQHVYSVPDLVAPGAAITSAVPGDRYDTWDGTSMATPVAAGIAALILERHPDIAVLDLMGELGGACLDLGEPDVRQGQGEVRIPASLLPAPTKRKRAPAKRKKAPAKRKKAPAKRKKAPAKRKKAPAKRKKATAKRKKARANRKKAPTKRKRAKRRAAKKRS